MSSSWTLLPRFRGTGRYCRQGLQGAVAALCFLTLAACGQSTPSQTSNTVTSTDTIAAVSAPPAAGDRAPAPGTTGTAKDANGLPVLQPRGVNASQLFAQKLGDSDDRMNRLETAVQELRNDFDSMAPSIVKLVAVEKDIQELVTQLETLVSGEPAVPPVDAATLDANPYATVSGPAAANGADGAPLPLNDEHHSTATPVVPPPPAPASAPPAAPVAPPPVAANPAGPAVTAVRIGEHPGKTRIVLDMSAKSAFTADLDNGEKILVVELPAAGWSAATHQSFGNSPLLNAYDVSPSSSGSGSLLILKLKANASILYKADMPGDNGKGHKIVIDIGKTAPAGSLTQ